MGKKSQPGSHTQQESTVKKITLALLFSLGALSLFGCHRVFHTQEQTLQPMEQSYRGLLPCADCSGIETSLFLAEDGTYVLQEHYTGDEKPTDTAAETRVFATYGRWARTADKLVLTSREGEKRYFRAHEKSLEMLDRNGTPISSAFNYTLQSVTAQLPATPMTMSGMFRQQAGNAMFHDCTTGKTYPVAHQTDLERAFRKVRGDDQEAEPVFLTLAGHYALQPDTRSGEPTRTLVPDSTLQFSPGKKCD
jgi:copper homeostasis protein (lipoprotein)